jgi:hypothetical protein
MAEDLPPRIAVEKPTKEAPKKQAGFLSEFVFENECVMRSINRIVEDTNKKNRNTAGYRVFSNIDAAIEPCLELIVEQAGERTSFPLKRSTRIQEIVFVLAPPDGSR